MDGVYTGVQNVDIEIDKDTEAVALGQVFTVYDSDYYVIGAVVIGEATGSAQNLAYILSGAKSEEKKDDTYYWTFEAVLNGQVQTLTAKSKYSSTITPLTKGTVMELRFDGFDPHVVTDAEDVDGNTGAEVDVFLAVHIIQNCAFAVVQYGTDPVVYIDDIFFIKGFIIFCHEGIPSFL